MKNEKGKEEKEVFSQTYEEAYGTLLAQIEALAAQAQELSTDLRYQANREENQKRFAQIYQEAQSLTALAYDLQARAEEEKARRGNHQAEEEACRLKAQAEAARYRAQKAKRYIEEAEKAEQETEA